MKNLKTPVAVITAALLLSACSKSDMVSSEMENIPESTSSVSMNAISGGKKVTDIIKPGTSFYLMNENFNTKYNLNPGDTVVLKAGTYGDIDIAQIDGITFINEGQVTMNAFTLNPGAKNVKLLGNGTPSIKYGIKLKGVKRFPVFFQATGNLEIAYLDITGVAGIELKHCPSGSYPQNFATAKIHNNYIHNTQLEGMYVGCDDLSMNVLINAHIYNNIVENTGNDGIQTRNGTFTIENNTVKNVGIAPAFAYDVEGILIGGNTKGSIIRGNTISGVNSGNAIFNDGFGEQIIECNTISSSLSAIYTNNYHPNEDLQNVGYLNLIVRNNTITSSQKSIEANYDGTKNVPFSITYTGNKSSQSPYFDKGIVVTQSNNGSSVTPVCGSTPGPAPAPDPTPVTNQAPVANAGSNATITLPVNSLTLSGSGTDADGSIVSYAWTKTSGPSAISIASPASAKTVISALVQGTYTMQLKVTDNKGATATSSVTITVKALTSLPNVAPVANAGSNKSFRLPTNSVTLTGTGTDSDGSIVSYSWTKVSGPAQINIQNPASAKTLISGLVEGQYVLELKVTDNKGATDTDRMVITVNPSLSSSGSTTAPATVKVEAEKFSSMQGIVVRSENGTTWVGHVDNGDWMDYSVNVAEAGTKTITLRVSAPSSSRKLQIRNASGTVLATVNLPTARWWGDWMNVSVNVNLPKGTQTLRLYASQSPFDIDWFEIK